MNQQGTKTPRGIEWTFGISRKYMAWVLAPFLVVCLLIGVLLLISPQSSRYIFVAQWWVKSAWTRGNDYELKPPENYTGVWKTWSPSGILYKEATYKDGQLNGPFMLWDFESGKKRFFETTYRAGKYNGAYTVFSDNGVVVKDYHFVDGKKTGRWIEYYSDGKKHGECFYVAPDVIDGEQLHWDTNGVISKKIWHQGEPWDGHFWIYRGTNCYEEQYESGKLVSSKKEIPLPRGALRMRRLAGTNSQN